MKINLGCGTDIRHGYINVDRLPPNQLPPDVYKQGDISSLDWLTENNTVDEIVALDCLEYLPADKLESTIVNWAQKLVPGGILKILVPDCHIVAKSFSQGQFNLQEYSQLTFGTRENGDYRLSVIDALTLIDFLQKASMTISLKRYEGIAIYVEATR